MTQQVLENLCDLFLELDRSGHVWPSDEPSATQLNEDSTDASYSHGGKAKAVKNRKSTVCKPADIKPADRKPTPARRNKAAEGMGDKGAKNSRAGQSPATKTHRQKAGAV